MSIEDIKIGETYNVRVKVRRMNPPGVVCYACDKDGHYLSEHPNFFTEDEVEAFSPITPENGTKNSAPAPKHAPCRKFRKGDKVRIKTVNGRDFNSFAEEHKGKILTVLKDEEKHCNIFVETPISDDFFVNPAYLELVTPVEELEPYSIDECGFANVVYLRKNGKTYMTIPYAHPVCLFKTEAEALAAAEVERDRLNAEYRKEQS